jgi:hypothetical protein
MVSPKSTPLLSRSSTNTVSLQQVTSFSSTLQAPHLLPPSPQVLALIAGAAIYALQSQVDSKGRNLTVAETSLAQARFKVSSLYP